MKKIIFLLMLISVSTYAQRANLDREYVPVNYVQLPSNPIMDNAQRTYTTNNANVTVAGFSKVKTNGSLEISFRFQGTRIENVQIKTEKHQTKNKEGKVTKTTYTYNAIADFNSKGIVEVYNVLTTKHHNKNLTQTYHFRKSFKSYSAASKYLKDNRYSIRSRQSSDHQRKMKSIAKNHLNNLFGYPIVKGKELIWILGSKKHPEFSNHHANFDKMEAAFSKMNYLDPIQNIELELKEVITYFENVVSKYPGKKKKYRKMRYASYYALAKMYYLLDNPSKTIEYGQKIIDNDYAKGKGKNLVRIGKLLESRFNVNQTTTRHFDVLTEDLTHESQSSVNDSNQSVLAYLITKANDTITTNILAKDLLKINYGVNLQVNDKITHYKASDCKTLALTNEDMYEVIAFNEVKKGNVTSDLKFVKVLFQSSKISLFIFNNEELVIQKDGKNLSTLSSSFAFGFNKKLGSFCGDCPSVLERTQNKEFKNNKESLLSFCKAYSKCE